MDITYECIKEFDVLPYRVRLWIAGQDRDRAYDICQEVQVYSFKEVKYLDDTCLAEKILQQWGEINAVQVSIDGDGVVLYRDWP